MLHTQTQLQEANSIIQKAKIDIEELLGEKVDVIYSVLGSKDNRINIITPEDIMKVVAKVIGITVSDITRKDRSNIKFIYSRYITASLCRTMTSLTVKVIGLKMNRDHTSVLNQSSQLILQYDKDNMLKTYYDKSKFEILKLTSNKKAPN